MDQTNHIRDPTYYTLDGEAHQTSADLRKYLAEPEEPRPTLPQSSADDYGVFLGQTQEPPLRDPILDVPSAKALEPGVSELPLPCPISFSGRGSKSYTQDIWESHKSRIQQLYIEEGKTLREVTRTMSDERSFQPSMKMYKTRLAAWGFYKNNRARDVKEMIHRKKAREFEGKSSVIFRSGKSVDTGQMLQYLKRKGQNPRSILQRTTNDNAGHNMRHILVRTPSPNLSERLPLPFGSFPDMQKIIVKIKEWYMNWGSRISPIPSDPSRHTLPPIFRLADFQSQTMDSISLLIRRGVQLFSLGRMAEGGSCIRGGFFLLDRLLCGVPKHGSSLEAPVWIFGLWALLSESIPTDISKMLLAHIVALAQQLLPELHPVQDILCCLRRIHGTNGIEFFSQFLSTVWASAVDEVTNTLYSNGVNASQCLPSVFWMGKRNDCVRQAQEAFLEFRRTESIEKWQQRVKTRSYELCDSRQLLHPAPHHRDIVVVMWLRRYVVDRNIVSQSCNPSKSDDINSGDKDVCTVKSAILTRMEMSMGKSNTTDEYDNPRVLSTDEYQVVNLHHCPKGEKMELFKRRHSLHNKSFEQAEAMLRQTLGVESEKGSWMKWLQVLEGSLAQSQDMATVPDYQEAESFASVKDSRGKGFGCDYMNTDYGEIGINKWGIKRSTIDEGYHGVHLAYLQN